MNRTKRHIINFAEIDGCEINAIIASSSDGKRLLYTYNVGDSVGFYIVTVNGDETFRDAASNGIHEAIEAYNAA